jgi:NTP pyrophosphatase (non-canonical NTP hydrolase)
MGRGGRIRGTKMSTFNKLNDSQAERLAILLEELGEVQQAIGKILRHGYESHHPDYPEKNNRQGLEEELGHVMYIVHLMASCDDVDMNELRCHEYDKQRSIRKYLHHQ